jgi:hypothetical protein
MGSKNKPGSFDCFAKADPDEPMFVLLGRDPTASMLTVLWVRLRIALGENPRSDQILEALETAGELEKWAAKLGKGKKIAVARLELASLMKKGH